MHKITVAICAYNCQNYIKETLEAITAQTFQDFDLFIYNDCSSDNSVSVIEEYFINNPRKYKLINAKKNNGLAFGRKYVELNVLTKYIIFIDADDIPLPELVEKLYTKINSDSDLIAVGCHHHFIDQSGKKIGGGIFMGCKDKNEFYALAKKRKLIFMQPTAIIDREALLMCGGRNIDGFFKGQPRYQDLCEDLDLWTRMSDLYVNGKAIIVLPEVLCNYRKHDSGLSNNSYGMILRMRHIKTNLINRREGLPQIDFVDFYNSLTDNKLNLYRKQANSSDYFKKAVYEIKKLNFFLFIYFIFKCFKNDRTYIWQKIKANSGIFK